MADDKYRQERDRANAWERERYNINKRIEQDRKRREYKRIKEEERQRRGR